MTHITMRVAMWERGLALVPADEDAHLFKDVQLEILYVDGCMVFVPSDRGVALIFRRTTHSDPCLLYEFPYEEPWDLPRFTLHKVELSLDEDGSMTWQVPPLDELPWTIAQGLSANRRAEVAKRDLELRVRSAAGDYLILTRVAMNTPDWVRVALRCSVWNAIFGRT